jgi:hypothetical protein
LRKAAIERHVGAPRRDTGASRKISNSGDNAMGTESAEHAGQAGADKFAKSGQAAEKMLKGGSDALVESVQSSSAAFKDLAQAYRDLAAKNVEKLSAAMAALSEIKKPQDFFEFQQKMIKDSVETAVNDSQRIAKLTAAAFTAPFAPIEKRAEAALSNAQH